jgi:hypothetical protein
MNPIIEPILAGLCVSLFNNFILNNGSFIMNWCSPQTVTVEHEDTVSSSNTTISDISFDTHVHRH